MADETVAPTEQQIKEERFSQILSDFNGGKGDTKNQAPVVPPVQDAPPPNQDAPPAEKAPIADDDYKGRYEALVAEHEPIKLKAQEADNYKAQLEADPYDGDTEVSAIAKLKKQGVPLKTAIQYLEMDLAKLSPLEKKVLSAQLDKPSVPREKLEKFIKQEYKLGEYAPLNEDETPNETDGLDRLEIEVAGRGGLDEKLAKQKEELLTQAAKPRSEVKLEQTQAQLQTQWTKEVPNIENTLKAYEVKVEGLETPVKINLEGYGQEKLQEYIDRVVKGGHEMTPENIEFVKKQVMKDAVIDNLPKIALEIAKASNGKLDKKYLDELHNPSAHKPAPTGGAPKKTKQEELQYAIDNMGK